MIHPFAEHIAYFILFAIPLLTTLLTRTASIASFAGYVMYIDFMNSKRLFHLFPPLKFLYYPPSYVLTLPSFYTVPKIKLFLWKIMNQALPVGSQLALRNIGAALNCKRCDNPESINHLLFHCEFSQKVWSLAPYTHSLDSRGLVDFASCWVTLCKLTCLPPAGITLGPLAPWILWAIFLAG